MSLLHSKLEAQIDVWVKDATKPENLRDLELKDRMQAQMMAMALPGLAKKILKTISEDQLNAMLHWLMTNGPDLLADFASEAENLSVTEGEMKDE